MLASARTWEVNSQGIANGATRVEDVVLNNLAYLDRSAYDVWEGDRLTYGLMDATEVDDKLTVDEHPEIVRALKHDKVRTSYVIHYAEKNLIVRRPS